LHGYSILKNIIKITVVTGLCITYAQAESTPPAIVPYPSLSKSIGKLKNIATMPDAQYFAGITSKAPPLAQRAMHISVQ